jgi:regulator of protease activity HflC (stomatin/prohibitin superfamily)
VVDGPTGSAGGREDDENGEDDQEGPSLLGAAPTLAVSRQSRRQRRNIGGEGGGGGRRLPKIGLGPRALILLVVIVLLAFGPAFASALKKTPRNMIGISYGGGPFEAAKFQRVVNPGSSLFFNGWFDPLYLYPFDQQNYIISKQVGVGATQQVDSVVAPTSDRVQLEYQVAVYFKLDTDRLRDFHEQLGLKYKAYTSSGWNSLIQDTFRQQIENSLQEETRRYDVGQLYGNAQRLVALQTAVQKTLSDRLKAALGDQYFCAPTFRPGGRCDDPTFVVKKIDVPKSVVSAFENNRTSQIQIQTMLNQVRQRQAEAQGIKALNEQLAIAGQNYVLLKAIESGSINFWVIPDGTGLNLTTPGASGGATTPTNPSATPSSSTTIPGG